MKLLLLVPITFCILLHSCNEVKTGKTTLKAEISSVSPIKKTTLPAKEPSAQFRSYWFDGKAEITSYQLEQVRYGEIRNGKSVLIYVTEDFLPQKQVKADVQDPNNIPVLKLNGTKKFNTGIYPYSIMESTFYPIANNQHAIKVSSSIQEWCGHVYAQLNNKEQFDITSHSYFASESDQKFSVPKTVLENELWSKIRIDPTSLPTGNISVIPSLEYSRLKHLEIKAYKAIATLEKKDNLSIYSIDYPNLKRQLTINFETNFPHQIIEWTETYVDGGKQMTTKATKIKTLKTAYWGKNSNADLPLRDELQLN